MADKSEKNSRPKTWYKGIVGVEDVDDFGRTKQEADNESDRNAVKKFNDRFGSLAKMLTLGKDGKLVAKEKIETNVEEPKELTEEEKKLLASLQEQR